MDSESLGTNVYKCEWRVPNYQTVLGKSKPKQKITSQKSDELPINGVPVTCKMIFFPKGLGKDDDERPVVATQFASEGEEAVSLSFKCLVRSVSSSMEILDDAVEANSGLTGTSGAFGDPSMCTFTIPDTAASLILSVTFRPFTEERELIDNVRNGIFSFRSAVTSFMASPQNAAPKQDENADGDAPEDVGGSASQPSAIPNCSEEDARYLTAFTQAPESAFWANGKWSVLVHVCISFAMAEAQAVDLNAPSDDVKGILFEKCPPMRTRSLEASHDLQSAHSFWTGLLTTVEGYSMITSIEALRARLAEEKESDDLLSVLLFAVDPKSISFFIPTEVEATVALLREAAEMLLEAPYADSDGAQFIVKAIEGADLLRRAALGKQSALRESISALISYHTWSLEAEECLARQLQSPTVDPLAAAISAAQRLQQCLQ